MFDEEFDGDPDEGGEVGLDDDDEDDDDDDRDDDDHDDDCVFPYRTNPDLIDVTVRLTDDLWSGRLSKFIFARSEYEENLARTYCPEDEISFYVVHFLSVKLEEILTDRSSRFLIWAAFECEFYQITDESERVSRWSSLRNRTTFCPSLSSTEDTARFVKNFMRNFANEALSDCVEMESVFSLVLKTDKKMKPALPVLLRTSVRLYIYLA